MANNVEPLGGPAQTLGSGNPSESLKSMPSTQTAMAQVPKIYRLYKTGKSIKDAFDKTSLGKALSQSKIYRRKASLINQLSQKARKKLKTKRKRKKNEKLWNWRNFIKPRTISKIPFPLPVLLLFKVIPDFTAR